jgi:hypothetical protein
VENAEVIVALINVYLLAMCPSYEGLSQYSRAVTLSSSAGPCQLVVLYCIMCSMPSRFVCLSAYHPENSLAVIETGRKRTGFRSSWCNSLVHALVHSVSGVMGCIEINPCHHGMARPQFADGGTSTNMEVAANILNKQSRTADMGGPPTGLGEVLTTPRCKKLAL